METFKLFLENQQLREKTIYEYTTAVERFFAWYEQSQGEKLDDLSKLNEEDLLTYRSYLLSVQKLKPETINKNLAALRKWLRWLQGKGKWTKKINLPDIPKQEKYTSPKWLQPSEVSAILHGIEQTKNDFLRSRDRCMIYFCLYTALRIGEVTQLHVDDLILTPGKQKVIIREGKGGKYRKVPIVNTKLKSAINSWLEERATSKFASSPSLFISFRSEKLTIGAIDKMVKRIQKSAHVEFTTHQLRHTCLHAFYDITKDLRLTQMFAGHDSPNTTAIYTNPGEDQLIEALKKVNLY